MKIYLAARYSRHPEMREVRDWLEERGHKVTSRWIDCYGGTLPDAFSVEELNAHPERCAAQALHDVEDSREADWVINFTGSGGQRGGRHAEFGMTVERGQRVILVGPREHVFHCLPQVEHYPDWPTLQAALDGGA
jgi:hypothetical protein